MQWVLCFIRNSCKNKGVTVDDSIFKKTRPRRPRLGAEHGERFGAIRFDFAGRRRKTGQGKVDYICRVREAQARSKCADTIKKAAAGHEVASFITKSAAR